MGNLEMLLETYDARTTEALERAASSLLDDLALDCRGMVDDGASAANADEGWGKHAGCTMRRRLQVLGGES